MIPILFYSVGKGVLARPILIFMIRMTQAFMKISST